MSGMSCSEGKLNLSIHPHADHLTPLTEANNKIYSYIYLAHIARKPKNIL